MAKAKNEKEPFVSKGVNPDLILVAQFHCDGCGKGIDLVGTDVSEESSGMYYCTHCGKGGKQFYSFDDYYVKKV